MQRPSLNLVLPAVALCLVAWGCGPEAVDDAWRFQIYDRAPESGDYRLETAEIETLKDLEQADGTVARLRGGGNIRIGTAQPETREDYEDTLSIVGDTTPDLDYERRDDGVIVPWDFHSTMMLSLYHHLEAAHHYFVDLGVDPETLGKVPVYYNVRLELFLPISLLNDNAAYAFTLDAFLIPPRLLLEDVPLAANRGVIVHEYTHLVANRLIHENRRAPDYLVESWPTAEHNRITSLEEGLADVFAALQTGDPNFISSSISEEQFDIDRDVSEARDYTESLADDVDSESPTSYNPYRLGTVIASTIWVLRPSLSDEKLGGAVLEAMREFASVEPPFTIARFFNTLHDKLPESAQSDACQLFRARLIAVRDELSCDS